MYEYGFERSISQLADCSCGRHTVENWSHLRVAVFHCPSQSVFIVICSYPVNNMGSQVCFCYNLVLHRLLLACTFIRLIAISMLWGGRRYMFSLLFLDLLKYYAAIKISKKLFFVINDVVLYYLLYLHRLPMIGSIHVICTILFWYLEGVDREVHCLHLSTPSITTKCLRYSG